jgi:uncharacterized protein
MGLKEEAKKQEEKYFLEREKKLIDELRKKRDEKQKLGQAEEDAKRREERKKLHWMCCPKCGHEMKTQDFHGFQVEICTFCEGVFFDRGELEDLYLKREEVQKKGFFKSVLGIVLD